MACEAANERYRTILQRYHTPFLFNDGARNDPVRESRTINNFGTAEYVHEQHIRARRRIEFFPDRIASRQ